ncbi:hypothetical protein OSTOST_01833 [Ostertagia ostertagi]
MIERTTRSVPPKTATTDDKMATARDSTDKSLITSASTAGAPTAPAISSAEAQGGTALNQAAPSLNTSVPKAIEAEAQNRQGPAPLAMPTTTPVSRALLRSDMTISGQSSVDTSVRSSKMTGADIVGGPVSVSAMRQKSTLKTSSSTATEAQAKSGPKATRKAASKTRTATRSGTRKKKSRSISPRSLSSQPLSNTSSEVRF